MMKINPNGAAVADFSTALDHSANVMLIVAALTIGAMLASVRYRTRSQVPAGSWSPGLIATFVVLCGLRRVGDVVAFRLDSPPELLAFDSACDVLLVVTVFLMVLRLRGFVRILQCLPTREQYRKDVAAMDLKYREQDERYAALATRERGIRHRLDELEALIIQCCWLRERGDVIERLKALLEGLEERNVSSRTA